MKACIKGDDLMQYSYFAVKIQQFLGELRCFCRNFCIFAAVNIKFNDLYTQI